MKSGDLLTHRLSGYYTSSQSSLVEDSNLGEWFTINIKQPVLHAAGPRSGDRCNEAPLAGQAGSEASASRVGPLCNFVVLNRSLEHPPAVMQSVLLLCVKLNVSLPLRSTFAMPEMPQS